MDFKTENFVMKKGIEVCEATKLLEKRRILYEVDEAFNNQMEEYHRNMEKFKKHEETIKEHDFKVQENFIKYCKFLTENKNKRNRAIRHFVKERKEKESKKKDMEKEVNILELLDQHKNLFERKIEQMLQYEHYLQRIVEDNQEYYNDINDLIQRFKILENSNQKLKNELIEVEANQKQLDEEINKFEKNKNDQIMMINNENAILQKKFEDIEIKYSKAKDNINSSEHNTAKKMQDLAKIMLSIDNIYCIIQESEIKVWIDQMEDDKENRMMASRQKSLQKNKINSNENNYKYKPKEFIQKLEYIRSNCEAYKKIYDLVNDKRITQ